MLLSFTLVGRVSSVGIATRYGLDGPGIVYWRVRDFPHPSRPALGPCLLYNMYRASFLGINRLKFGVEHAPNLAAGLRKE
jgi:hypothetical protein